MINIILLAHDIEAPRDAEKGPGLFSVLFKTTHCKLTTRRVYPYNGPM